MKSPTPLIVCYCSGVEPTLEFLAWCEEKGHYIYPIENGPRKEYLPHMILGPHVYNHQGSLEKKHFDLYTKSLRATMRETKKAMKGGK